MRFGLLFLERPFNQARRPGVINSRENGTRPSGLIVVSVHNQAQRPTRGHFLFFFFSLKFLIQISLRMNSTNPIVTVKVEISSKYRLLDTFDHSDKLQNQFIKINIAIIERKLFINLNRKLMILNISSKIKVTLSNEAFIIKLKTHSHFCTNKGDT